MKSLCKIFPQDINHFRSITVKSVVYHNIIVSRDGWRLADKTNPIQKFECLPNRLPLFGSAKCQPVICKHSPVPATQVQHNAIEGDLTFVSEPELGHSAFHYPRLGNFISLFNKI